MCLITIGWKAHPNFELVIVANRDEFHNRPAAPAAWWSDAPDIFGGRDLSRGGSWVAVSRGGRLAAVTNVRRMVPPNPQAPSRGGLVAGFVRSAMSASDYVASLADTADHYSGFNLLLYDGAALLYASNHPKLCSVVVTPGVHGISNADLDTPWPKVNRLTTVMRGWCKAGASNSQPLLAALADRTQSADTELPDTGVGLELERLLSPPFIVSETYGTRCSSVITFGGDGSIDFFERRFDAAGEAIGDTRENLGPERPR